MRIAGKLKMLFASVVSLIGVALLWGSAYGVPTLQLGISLTDPFVPTVSGLAPYITVGEDENTAFTDNANFILVLGGQYGPNTTLLGGEDGNTYQSLVGSSLGWPSGTYNLIIVASVPEGSSGTVTVGGASPFFTSDTFGPLRLNSHYPTGDSASDFLFFSVPTSFLTLLSDGSYGFANNEDGVRNFAEPGIGDGEEIGVPVSITDYQRVHFDMFAIETTETGPAAHRIIRSTLETNPNSHDVTVVPEPATMMLLGSGLVGLAGLGRKKFFRRKEG